MLYFLTGEIQTGKTRWLQAHIEELEREGLSVYGVLSPGIWRKREAGELAQNRASCPGEFEKLGINCILYPSREQFVFAQRRDLAQKAGECDTGSQSAKAQLGWAIADETIARVNSHFASIAHLAQECEKTSPANAEKFKTQKETPNSNVANKGLLVIDELGRLELLRGEGFVQAMELLKLGPTSIYQDAIVIVRDELIEIAEEKFTPAWGGSKRIYPK